MYAHTLIVLLLRHDTEYDQAFLGFFHPLCVSIVPLRVEGYGNERRRRAEGQISEEGLEVGLIFSFVRFISAAQKWLKIIESTPRIIAILMFHCRLPPRILDSRRYQWLLISFIVVPRAGPLFLFNFSTPPISFDDHVVDARIRTSPSSSASSRIYQHPSAR